MKVTDVRIRRLNQEGKMRAIVSVTLNDQFVVHDVRVIEGTNGYFVAMPSKRIPTASLKISPIPSIPRPGRRSSRRFWKLILKSWKCSPSPVKD